LSELFIKNAVKFFASSISGKYPDIAEKTFQENKAKPYYTNSTHLPVSYTGDPFEELDLQDELQTKYTGGTVLHFFLGEKITPEAAKLFVKKVAGSYHLPYFTLTPTFSICPKHGYLAGEHEYCPKCDAEIGYNENKDHVEDEELQKANRGQVMDAVRDIPVATSIKDHAGAASLVEQKTI